MDRGAVAAVAALHDDVRRALYSYVRAAGAPVTREDAADAIGISRKLAAFHLDKLVTLGLLNSAIAGPGTRRVGRAPRMYEPSAADVAVHLPERSPELLAGILVAAVTGQQADEDAEQAALRVARQRGAEAGSEARAGTRGGRLGAERAAALAYDVLVDHGFEPYQAESGTRLRNCPFHPLASQAPTFVCGLNREYLAGVVDGLGADSSLVAELAPAPGECCVQLRPVVRR